MTDNFTVEMLTDSDLIVPEYNLGRTAVVRPLGETSPVALWAIVGTPKPDGYSNFSQSRYSSRFRMDRLLGKPFMTIEEYEGNFDDEGEPTSPMEFGVVYMPYGDDDFYSTYDENTVNVEAGGYSSVEEAEAAMRNLILASMS